MYAVNLEKAKTDQKVTSFSLNQVCYFGFTSLGYGEQN